MAKTAIFNENMECKIRNTIQCEDYIVISEDETPIPIKKKNRNRKKKKCERTVSLRAIEKNTEKLVITQKVQVKKQKIKCVINLNTNVYENKINKHKVEQQKPGLIVPKANCSSISSIERIVPTCGRKSCKAIAKIKKKTNVKREIREETKTKRSLRSKQKVVTCRYKKRKNSKRKCHSSSKRSKHSRLPRERKPSETLSLSSISLSPLITHEISYEDISLDSFSNCSEGDLDTLIKRTKERDRQHSFNGQLLHCSTSNNIIELSSDDDVLVIDEKSTTTSIHSTAKLVLDNSAYTPEISQGAVTSSLFSKQEECTDKYCENILIKKSTDYDQKVPSNFLFSDVHKNIQPYYYDDNINNNLKDVKNENVANIFLKSTKSEADNGLETKQ